MSEIVADIGLDRLLRVLSFILRTIPLATSLIS